jgi:hypothetical protein
MNAQQIKAHLKDYKESSLGIKEEGFWRSKQYGHILPQILLKENIIPSPCYKAKIIEKIASMDLHIHFHHLNSSQAMCINFFYPLCIEQQLDFILNILGLNNEKVNYDTPEFEKKSDIDNKNGYRPTSFDFYFETNSGKKLYFEIKYTENEFGKAKQDKVHQNKYNTIYKTAANGIITNNNVQLFLDNYQIMRNLIHISSNSYVVFLIPRNNTQIYRQASNAVGFITQQYKKNVRVLTWDNLFQRTACVTPIALQKYFDAFKTKYVI